MYPLPRGSQYSSRRSSMSSLLHSMNKMTLGNVIPRGRGAIEQRLSSAKAGVPYNLSQLNDSIQNYFAHRHHQDQMMGASSPAYPYHQQAHSNDSSFASGYPNNGDLWTRVQQTPPQQPPHCFATPPNSVPQQQQYSMPPFSRTFTKQQFFAQQQQPHQSSYQFNNHRSNIPSKQTFLVISRGVCFQVPKSKLNWEQKLEPTPLVIRFQVLESNT